MSTARFALLLLLLTPPGHVYVVSRQHLKRVVEAVVAPGGCFVHVAPEAGEGRQGGAQFVEAMKEAGWECQLSQVPEAYHRNVLADASDEARLVPDEEFEVRFAELSSKSYTLYCYSRRAPGDI